MLPLNILPRSDSLQKVSTAFALSSFLTWCKQFQTSSLATETQSLVLAKPACHCTHFEDGACGQEVQDESSTHLVE